VRSSSSFVTVWFDGLTIDRVPTDTVGCTDLPVFRRPIRRNPELIYNRPYDVRRTELALLNARKRRDRVDSAQSYSVRGG
jgi:hypothetical protein